MKPNKPRRPTTWSYSALSLFEKCAAQFKYAKIDKLPQPESPHLVRGNKVHAQLERALRADTSDAGVPEVSLIEYVATLKARRPVVEEMWHFDRRWNFLGTEFAPTSWLLVRMDAYVPPVRGLPCDCEKKHVEKWAKWTVGGKRGARPVLAHKPTCPRNAHVVDWKTGKKYSEHEKQGELYALASAAREGIAETEHQTEVDVDMVYVDRGEVDRWSLPLTYEGYVEATGEWSERAEKMLGEREYRPTPSQFACRFCAFSGRKGGPCRAG